MANGDTKTNQYLDIAANGTRADLPSDTCCETRTQTLIRGVAERVMDVEDEVERLENNPDVVDIVATYQDLQNYDTSGLTDKDIIRVLEDSTHDNNSTYYRWNATTSQFDFVGEISGGSSVNVVQAIGTSTTDVMSQDATTKMIYPSGGTGIRIGTSDSVMSASSNSVAIGTHMYESSLYSVGIGYANTAKSQNSVVIGTSAQVTYPNDFASIAIGQSSKVSASGAMNAIALGAYANATMKGQMDISTGSNSTYGYNDSNYRLLTGLYDPQSDHDAATKGYVDTAVAGAGGGEPDYSMSEVDTGTKWVDGKTIYKKTIEIPSLPNGNFTINLGITNLYRVIEVKGFLYNPYNPTGGFPLVNASTSGLTNQAGISISSGTMTINTSGRDGWNGYATIYYTKSE